MDTSKIDSIKKSFDQEIKNVTSIEELSKIRTQYLGRKGILTEIFQYFNKLPEAERKEIGEGANKLRKYIEEVLHQYIKKFGDKSGTSTDVTLPGIKRHLGSLHPTSTAIYEIVQIFNHLGFIRMSYQEVEWEYFAFEALNMPEGHPARDDFETFFIDSLPSKKYGRMLLTPHTSNGQVREMLRVGSPPVKMINIARCYRPNWDTTHTPMFHQFEGLCIDENINITNLKGTIDYFAGKYFGGGRKIRLRPFHFQFTEPSFEVDITCDLCKGLGVVGSEKCKVCKSGWLEVGGAGMVHPNVLRAGGIDPEKYSGWAFGFGIERVYMMREGLAIDDIRVLYSGDIRFLKQFK